MNKIEKNRRCERQHSIIITINIYIRLSYDDEEDEKDEDE